MTTVDQYMGFEAGLQQDRATRGASKFAREVMWAYWYHAEVHTRDRTLASTIGEIRCQEGHMGGLREGSWRHAMPQVCHVRKMRRFLRRLGLLERDLAGRHRLSRSGRAVFTGAAAERMRQWGSASATTRAFRQLGLEVET